MSQFYDAVYGNAEFKSAQLVLNYLSKARSGFKVCHFNARSLNDQKFDYIKTVFDGTKVDVICVSETWFDPEIPDHIRNLSNYTLIRNDRVTSTTGGGVAIYCRSSLKCKILSRSDNNGIEFIIVEISDSNTKCLLACVYNPKRTCSFTPFFTALESFIISYEHIIVCGDFNVDLLKRDSTSFQLLDAIAGSGLNVINKYPTRYAPNCSPSLLDLIIVSEPTNIILNDQLCFDGISDHDLVFCTYGIDFSHSQVPSTFTFRNFKALDVEAFYIDASSVTWSDCYNLVHVDNKLNFIYNHVKRLFETHVPLKTVRIQNEKCPWYNFEVKNAIKSRRKYYLKWRRSPNPTTWRQYCYFRNQATLITRCAKRNFFASKLNTNLSSKQLWKNLRDIGIGKKLISKCELDPNDLNNQFTQTNQLATSFEPKAGLLYDGVNDFCFETVTEDEIIRTFKSLRSEAIGEDGIPLRFLKLVLPCLINALTHVFNHCIVTSTFPIAWKAARITPVPKKPTPSELADYRPVSILPCMSKVLEKILTKQIIDHFTSKRLLSPYQSGFRANHSCSTAMVKILEDIRLEYDKDNISVLCLLDFSKAFDKVDHRVLCQKLEHYFGFSNSAVRLIGSYLCNRTQRVCVGNNFSAHTYLKMGVPQGSILGPILFCAFINDLPSVCEHVSFHLYADDIQIYLSRRIGLIEDLVFRVNEDLERISNWAKENGLVLNPNKSQALLISKKTYNHRDLPSITLNSAHVSFVDSVTSLGFKISRDLSCRDHINSVIARIYGTLRKLWVSNSFTPQETKLRLMRTLLVPIISFSEVVYPKLDSLSEYKLRVALNDMTRYVYGIRRYDHISAFSKKILKCTMVEYVNFRNCIFLHRIIHTRTPEYLYEKIEFCTSSRTNNLVIPTFRYLNSSRLFFVHSIRLFNSLPVSIKRITDAVSFKTEVFKHFSNN